MDDTLERGSNRVLTHWQALDTSKKIAVVLVAAAVFFGLLYMAFFTGREGFVPLYSGLATTDAYDIIDQLKSAGVPYKLEDNGQTIMVRESQKHELRLQLASMGLPDGGSVGFELFDSQGFGVTEFTQKVNYKRAMEGELARTLRAFDQVEYAKVMLAIPESQLYVEQEKPVTASISLKLRGSKSLTDSQVRGMVHLTSSAVPGLTPENVTIVDTEGNVLWAHDSSQEALASKLTITQLEMKKRYERDLQQSLESLVEKIVGPGNCAIRVTAEMNFDQEISDQEIFEPVVDGRGIITSEQLVEEIVRTGVGATGIPGTATNVDDTVPTYPTVDDQSTTVQSRTETIRNYEVPRTVKHSEKTTPQVTRLSVSALVHSAGLTQGQVDILRQTIAIAAGIDPSRGDQISVESMAFAPRFTQDELDAMAAEVEKEEREQAIRRYARVALPAFLSLLAVIFGIVFLNMMRKKVQDIYLPGEEAMQMQLQAAAVEEEPEVDDLMAENSNPEERRKRQIREQVEKMARENPKEAAQLIQGWLAED